ncbi:MAG: pentapeptide repeat-containing protein [Hyphomicrobiales bacterium]|nr:MAG: pentapeptide repeat-containing protein [Hyphomicrobiales bacterium]
MTDSATPHSNHDIETPVLRPATESKWYLLATLFGEYQDGLDYQSADQLAIKNRRTWNRWQASRLTEEEREFFIEKGVDAGDLKPFSPAEFDELNEQMKIRTAGKVVALPAPSEESIDLTNLLFDKPANFSGFILPQASFGFSVFQGEALFIRSFLTMSSFYNACFTSWANFRSCHFLGYADFSHSQFSSCAFDGSAFGAAADFESCSFSEHADFSDVTISGEAKFLYCRFESMANFTGAKFSDVANFGGSRMLREAFFTKARFIRTVSFGDCYFDSGVDYQSAEFQFLTQFADARFKAEVPDFRGATLSEATEWHGAIWPEAPVDSRSAQRQVYAYERLKAEMERLKKHEDEQFFFAREMRARRALLYFRSLNNEVPLRERLASASSCLLNKLYDALSGYGLSIAKPLICLVVMAFLPAIFFAKTNSRVYDRMDFLSALGFSATNLLSFLPYKPEKGIADHLSVSAKIIANMQSVAGIILLFLLGLALRNRFRMK